MKTVQDYLNDPRITCESGLMAGPEEIRTIHAIRLKQQDETEGMSFEEKASLHQKKNGCRFCCSRATSSRICESFWSGKTGTPKICVFEHKTTAYGGLCYARM